MVTLALCAKAVGPERVVALHMPELHSADETLDLSGFVARHFGVRTIHEDITQTLEAFGFYKRYDEAVRSVFPEYGNGWKSKIVLQSITDKPGYSLFFLVAQSPDGELVKKRLNHQDEFHFSLPYQTLDLWFSARRRGPCCRSYG